MEVRRLVTLALLTLAGTVAASGCGTDAVGVDACRQIEEARCKQAPACGILIEPPHFTSGSTVDACIRYYDDACLHGLAVGDPGPTDVNACVAAINGDSMKKDGCSIVSEPQTDTAACGWLVPPASSTSDAAATPSSDAGVVVFDTGAD